MRREDRQALVAGGLSLLIPGLGQVLQRSYAVALFWIVMAVLFWNSTRSWLAFIVHLLSGLSAYWAVQRKFPAAKRRKR